MDPITNPYSPGAGQHPPELAGREKELKEFEVLLARLEAGRSQQGMILNGLRGVGKTVLLEEFRSQASKRGWIVAAVEAGTRRNFRALTAQALNRSLRSHSVKHKSASTLRTAMSVFKSFSLKAAPDGSLSVGIDVDPMVGRADSGDLELDFIELLSDLSQAAQELGTGVIVLVDELQQLHRKDIRALAGAAHHANRRRLPAAIIGAGLPNLPVLLTEAKSYAERLFTYPTIGALTQEAALKALVKPAKNLGVVWEKAASDQVLEASEGYPYFVQAFGQSVWKYAAGPKIIAADDATIGIQAAQDSLDEGFYRARWERATGAQKNYLEAMSKLSGDQQAVEVAEIATLLERSPNSLGNHREQLIRKGLIYAPQRGKIAYTVPGMGAYITRTI